MYIIKAVSLQIVNTKGIETVGVFTTYFNYKGREYSGFQVCESLDHGYDVAADMVQASNLTNEYVIKEWNKEGVRQEDTFVRVMCK